MGGNSSSPSKEKTSFLKAARSGKLLGVQDFLNRGGDVNVAYEVSLHSKMRLRVRKNNYLGFRTGPTQTSMYSRR